MDKRHLLAPSLALALIGGPLKAHPIELQRLIGPEDVAPGNAAALTLEARPLDCWTFSASRAFSGVSSQIGLYAATTLGISTIVDYRNMFPGSASTFGDFAQAACDSTQFVFVGTEAGVFPAERSLFRRTSPNSFQRLLGAGDTVDSESVLSVSGPSLSGETLSLKASLSGHSEAILFLATSSSLPRFVVGTGDAVPGGGADFAGFSFPRSIGNRVVFRGLFPILQSGLFSWQPDSGLEPLVVPGDAVPDLPGEVFLGIGFFAPYRDGVSFVATHGQGTAIYHWLEGSIARIVGAGDSTNLGVIEQVEVLASEGGTLAFSGVVAGQRSSLFVWNQGSLTRLVGLDDIVDGKRVIAFSFDAGASSVSITLIFADNTRSLYRVVLQPPLAIPVDWWSLASLATFLGALGVRFARFT